MKSRPTSHRQTSRLSNERNFGWRTALIALTVFGMALALGYSATAKGPGFLGKVVDGIAGATTNAGKRRGYRHGAATLAFRDTSVKVVTQLEIRAAFGSYNGGGLLGGN